MCPRVAQILGIETLQGEKINSVSWIPLVFALKTLPVVLVEAN